MTGVGRIQVLVPLVAASALVLLAVLRRHTLLSWHLPALLALAEIPGSVGIGAAAHQLARGFQGMAEAGGAGTGAGLLLESAQRTVRTGVLSSIGLLALGLVIALLSRKPQPVSTGANNRSHVVLLTFVFPALGLLAQALPLASFRWSLQLVTQAYTSTSEVPGELGELSRRLAATLLVAAIGGLALGLWLAVSAAVAAIIAPGASAPSYIVTGSRLLAAFTGLSLLTAAVVFSTPIDLQAVISPVVTQEPASPAGAPFAALAQEPEPTPLIERVPSPVRSPEEALDEGPFRPGADVTPAKVLHPVDPKYPPGNWGKVGVVILEAVIGPLELRKRQRM